MTFVVTENGKKVLTMAEIELKRRVKYAGDVHAELLKAGWDCCTAAEFLNNIPDADVATVRHGRWLQKKHKIFGNAYDYVCSECGCDYALAEYNYCPNCGAKMEKMDLKEEQHELRRDL